MGTQLISYEDCEEKNLNVLLKRYWGGTDNGIMYQISEKNAPFHYVNISQHDLHHICIEFIKHIEDFKDDD